MAIEVMLMDNVKKLGKAGEIVKVAPGYARNYLFTKGLASLATEAAKRRLKKLEAERAARAAEEKKAALEVAKKLDKLELTVSAPTTDGTKLFGRKLPDILPVNDNSTLCRTLQHIDTAHKGTFTGTAPTDNAVDVTVCYSKRDVFQGFYIAVRGLKHLGKVPYFYHILLSYNTQKAHRSIRPMCNLKPIYKF